MACNNRTSEELKVLMKKLIQDTATYLLTHKQAEKKVIF